MKNKFLITVTVNRLRFLVNGCSINVICVRQHIITCERKKMINKYSKTGFIMYSSIKRIVISVSEKYIESKLTWTGTHARTDGQKEFLNLNRKWNWELRMKTDGNSVAITDHTNRTTLLLSIFYLHMYAYKISLRHSHHSNLEHLLNCIIFYVSNALSWNEKR